MHLTCTGRPRRDEHGAVAILVALTMVGLCVAAAFVVDLGLLRVDHQVDKAAEDAAAMAGVNGLVPDTNNPIFHPFAGVCQALNYLKVNDSAFSNPAGIAWTNGNGGAIAGSPDGCDSSHASDVCTKDAPATWARLQATANDGKFRVTIQSGYKILPPSGTPNATYGNVNDVTGGAFAEDDLNAYNGDLGDPVDPAKWGGCDQIAVIITETRNTTLGAPAAGSMGTRVRSVARARVGDAVSPYALLILERSNCQVLTNGNNGVAAINVDGYKSHPGMIHADSDGTGSGCNKPVVIGQKADGIVAHEAPDTGAKGEISTVAGSNQTDGITNVYSGPKPPGYGPLTNGPVKRGVLDIVYRSGVQNAISNASFAWSAVQGSGTLPDPLIGASAGAWTKINNCAAATGAITATKVLVMCANMNNNASFPNATDIIFSGTLGGGSSTISMPKAQNVYVEGGGSNNNAVGVGSGTKLTMHDNDVACGASIDGARAKLIVHTGSLSVSGSFRACNTTVILLGSDDTGCVPSTDGTYYANGKVCNLLTKPGNGILDVNGNGSVDWTAPSLVDDELRATQPQHDALEDLALWTETYGVHGLGGTGVVHLSGVFAAPNADPLKLNGSPTWQVQNSQYVVRTLENDGGAIFNMKPSPTLPVAPPSLSFELVR